jgi:DNA-binding LacI/PurR family transcriptional regulator
MADSPDQPGAAADPPPAGRPVKGRAGGAATRTSLSAATPPPPTRTDPPTTIHDLARRLSVSSTTVWRALNDSPRVSSKTKQRIVSAARKFNYRPSLVAQTLSRGRTQTLGVVVPMIGNPVYASLVRAVEQAAFEHKYSMILCDTDFRPDREREYVDLLIRRRVEGVAVIPFAVRAGGGAGDFAHLAGLPGEGVEVVAMQQAIPDPRLDSVVPDNRAAARAMTEHLLRLGHRRIGFLHGGVPEWNVPMRERLEGYRLALESSGIGFDEGLVLQAGSFESVLTDDPGNFRPAAVAEFLARPDRPTAVFAPVDVLAIKVMDVVRDMGLRIPEDVAVAGFDDIFMSGHTTPPLTTVRHPTGTVGRRAAELLFEAFAAKREGRERREPVHERVPCELVIRKSCGHAG